MKKRILLVGPSITKSYGGMVTVEKQILNSNLLKNKYDIDFFDTYIDGSFLKRAIYSFYKCFYFCFHKVYKKYDLIHFHMASNGSTFRKMWLARIVFSHHVPYFVHIHGSDFDSFFIKQSRIKRTQILRFLSHAKCVIVLSEYWRAKLSGFGVNNCVVVPNCIDSSRFISLKANKNNDFTNFLFLGRVSKRKGIWDIVEAVKLLSLERKDFMVNVAGDGENKELDKLIKKEKLGAFFTIYGWVDGEAKRKLLSSSHVLLLPSYNEGLPMSILENMAAGKIIISSNVGGIPEVVSNNENGFIIAAGDVSMLLSSMKQCFSPETYVHISLENIKKIERNFDISVFDKKLLGLYDKIIGNENSEND
jgi:glycosyltransferase involved in cell wall biosynthesis